MSTVVDVAWPTALAAAGTPLADDAWRTGLATALRTDCGDVATFASVITCVPGNWLRLRWSSAPRAFDDVIEQIVSGFLPRMDVAEPWDVLLANHGAVFAPLHSAANRALSDEMIENVFAARGIRGFVVGYCIDRERALVGILCLGSTELDAPELLARVRAPLTAVAAVAGDVLDRALALARGLGATVPDGKSAAGAAKMTARESQVAHLLLQGLSDLNIATRLGISEETVGTHLSRVFRKSGVHSRAEFIAKSR